MTRNKETLTAVAKSLSSYYDKINERNNINFVISVSLLVSVLNCENKSSNTKNRNNGQNKDKAENFLEKAA